MYPCSAYFSTYFSITAQPRTFIFQIFKIVPSGNAHSTAPSPNIAARRVLLLHFLVIVVVVSSLFIKLLHLLVGPYIIRNSHHPFRLENIFPSTAAVGQACLAATAGAVHTRSGPSRSLPPALVGNPTRECRGLLLAPCCCIPLLSLTSLSIAGLPRYLTHTTVNSIGFPVPPDLDGLAFPQEHFISTTPYSMLLSRARAHELSLSAPPTSPAQHINAAGGRAYEAAANFCCLAAAAGAVHTRSGPSRSLPPALVGNPTRECRGLLLAPCCCIPLLSLTMALAIIRPFLIIRCRPVSSNPKKNNNSNNSNNNSEERNKRTHQPTNQPTNKK
eukprot:gene8280-5799_t